MVERSLDTVRAFVQQLHAKQTRKGGGPYYDHLIEVEELCSRIYSSDEIDLRSQYDRFDILAAALLHDSIEDTVADYEDVELVSNCRVADWVSVLSEDKRKPKLIRRSEYIEVLSVSCTAVQVIKLADVYSNVSGITFREEKEWISNYMPVVTAALDKLQRVQHLELFAESRKVISAIESKLLL